MNIQIERWSEPSSPDAEELKARLLDEGYSVFQCTDAPGTKYGPHAHAEDQSHWILSGELELRVGHETYGCAPAIEITSRPTRFIRRSFRMMKRYLI